MLNRSYYLIILSVVSLFSIEGHAAKSSVKIFDELVIESPVVLTHPILIVDILPDMGKELATLGVDEQGKRWLHVYKYNPKLVTYQMASSLVLPDDMSRFDVSEYKQGHLQTLYFLNAKSLFRYDAKARTLDKMIDVSTIFLRENPDYISRGHFVVDINEDGIDEILLTDFHGLNLLIQTPDKGLFVQTLPIKPFVVLGDGGVRFIPKNFLIQDVNDDQLKDIVFVGEGKLLSFNQRIANVESGSSLLNEHVTEINIASDISGIDWWHQRDAMGNGLDQTSLTYRKLVQLQDINNDGVVDMIVKSTQSSGVLDRANNYDIFLGQYVQGILTYHQDASSQISAEGTLSGFELVDINNDSRFEVMLSGFDIGLSQIIGALLSGGIDQDVYLFSMDENDHFMKKPKVAKEVELSFSLSSGQTGSPVVTLADINGDQRKDLILSSGEKKLRVYLGVEGRKLFSRRSIKYRTLLPKEGDVIEVSDVNDDGKEDLIIKYGRLDGESLSKTIRILLAK